MTGNKHIQQQRKRALENYDAFIRQIDSLMENHQGQYVLLRDGQIVDFFDGQIDAIRAGKLAYADGNFSVQHVAKTKQDMGILSRAIHIG